MKYLKTYENIFSPIIKPISKYLVKEPQRKLALRLEFFFNSINPDLNCSLEYNPTDLDNRIYLVKRPPDWKQKEITHGKPINRLMSIDVIQPIQVNIFGDQKEMTEILIKFLLNVFNPYIINSTGLGTGSFQDTKWFRFDKKYVPEIIKKLTKEEFDEFINSNKFGI